MEVPLTVRIDKGFSALRLLSGELNDLRPALQELSGRTSSTNTDIKSESKTPIQNEVTVGSFLVAHPLVISPTFSNAVILILSHDSKGTIGLIINKPNMDPFIGRPLVKKENLRKIRNRMFLGGPVMRSKKYMKVLHSIPQSVKSSQEVVPGVFLASSQNVPPSIASTVEQNELRFFDGYAKWEPNQLKTEVQQGTWFVTSGNSEKVFTQRKNTGDKLWKKVLTEMGGEFRHFANLPEYPRLTRLRRRTREFLY